MTGRPTLLNDELQKKICALITEGDRPEVAAGVNGIGRRTYYEWMQKGAKGEEPYATFRTEVARALDSFESESRRVILSGDEAGVGFGPAKARLEVLSRRMPRHWAQQVKHHIETLQDEFFEALKRVCGDPAVHARVREEKDCSFLLAAFCEEIARSESEGDAASDASGAGASVH